MIKKIHWKSKYSNIISVVYSTIAPHFRASKILTKMIFKVEAYSKHRYTKLKEIFSQTDLTLVSTVSSPLNPSVIYVLSKKA